VIAGPKDRTTILHLVREAAAASPSGDANGSASIAPKVLGTTALTRREVEVLRLMGAGMNTRAIARTLSVSEATWGDFFIVNVP
jgi:DNA-binding NarL/FixJ family response regulator